MDSSGNQSENPRGIRLPADSLIPDDKIIRYLLLPRHENDKSKFLALAGYTYSNWGALRDDLRAALASHDAVLTERNSYGEVYELRAAWTGPSGRRIAVVSVWIRLKATNDTRFVTLYPDKEATT